tara:strand:- start:293 stop:538 length:246 start_codon:yes stop_codon:yes gene_type:complete
MHSSKIIIEWPNGEISCNNSGEDWIHCANEAGISIPTGCLNGSCGACEIEVNGETIRACINQVPNSASGNLKVDFAYDPYW